jgi:TPP-dependent pyruvate/acetoin dehydrogenase alpha subunit
VGAKPYKILPSSEHAGHRALHAVGFSKASNEVVFCILGQAALANGSFLSACNLLQLQPSRVVFVVIEQEISDNAPVAKQSMYNMSKLADVFGLGYFEVSANGMEEDVLHETMNETLQEIWKGALEDKSSLFRIRLS